MRYMMMATILMATVVLATMNAQEGEILRAGDEVGESMYVRLPADQEQNVNAKDELQIHENAMSLAINEQGVTRATVAVREGGRVFLRSSENVGDGQVLARRFGSAPRPQSIEQAATR